jgi:hypothetical protein
MLIRAKYAACTVCRFKSKHRKVEGEGRGAQEKSLKKWSPFLTDAKMWIKVEKELSL